MPESSKQRVTGSLRGPQTEALTASRPSPEGNIGPSHRQQTFARPDSQRAMSESWDTTLKSSARMTEKTPISHLNTDQTPPSIYKEDMTLRNPMTNSVIEIFYLF